LNSTSGSCEGWRLFAFTSQGLQIAIKERSLSVSFFLTVRASNGLAMVKHFLAGPQLLFSDQYEAGRVGADTNVLW